MSCHGGQGKDGFTQTTRDEQKAMNHALTKEPDKYPVVSVVDSVHEFGKIKEGAVAVYAFPFKNTGAKPLVIDKVTTTCGCTIANYPVQPILPGKTGKISIQFHSKGKMGRQIKPIFIHANTHPSLSQLTITAEVLSSEKDSI